MSVIECSGYIFVVGGFDGSQTLNSVECYNPTNNRFDFYLLTNTMLYNCLSDEYKFATNKFQSGCSFRMFRMLNA